mmetsp:Transcript_1831/g.5811  ORF Transcript_1831/g.5811 Transcript_1831/m.5811 type:complete len:83 (+) Transcript_1831:289-537(+)
MATTSRTQQRSPTIIVSGVHRSTMLEKQVGYCMMTTIGCQLQRGLHVGISAGSRSTESQKHRRDILMSTLDCKMQRLTLLHT